jgi:hypothetical protein
MRLGHGVEKGRRKKEEGRWKKGQRAEAGIRYPESRIQNPGAGGPGVASRISALRSENPG